MALSDRQKTLVISGASGGIGKCTAEKFLSSGWKVFNLSRRESGIDGITDIPCDVTDEACVISAFSEISKFCGGIDILICNAGFGISGAVEFTPLDDAKKQVDVNLFGAFNCIKAAIPLLKKCSGRIICTSSAAAVFAIPFQAFYSVSKAGINMMVMALRNELKPFGVSACALMLGDVKTGFTAARKRNFAGDDIYKGAISRSVSVMEKDEQTGMAPESIAEVFYRTALKKKVKPLITVGASYRLFTLIEKLLPCSFVNFIVGKMYIPHK